MRLDVALMHHLHLELTRLDVVGIRHGRVRVAELVAELTHIVGVATLLGTGGVDELIVDGHHIGRNRIFHVRSGLQHLVLNVNGAQCFLSRVAVNRRDCRNSVAGVERLVGR